MLDYIGFPLCFWSLSPCLICPPCLFIPSCLISYFGKITLLLVFHPVRLLDRWEYDIKVDFTIFLNLIIGGFLPLGPTVPSKHQNHTMHSCHYYSMAPVLPSLLFAYVKFKYSEKVTEIWQNLPVPLVKTIFF